MTRVQVSDHARRQCEARGFVVELVEREVGAKLEAANVSDAAVLVGKLPAARGGLIGSNGNEVWAVVREATIVTVMLRRSDQPRSCRALRVANIVAEWETIGRKGGAR